MAYTIDRRRFLVQLGTVAAAGATTPLWYNLIDPRLLPFAWGGAASDVLAPGSPICVHIALDGGNDYLNTLVPVGDGFYNSATVGHGSIALTDADTLALTGTGYRLHNGLPWLANRWNAIGDVGFALGVGNVKNNFSHFDSMRYWETARLDVLGQTGWLGRYADLTQSQNPLGSVSINDARREAVSANAPTLVVQNCAEFAYAAALVNSDVFLTGARHMATIPGAAPVADVARMIGTTFEVAGRIQAAADSNITGDPQNPPNYAAVTKQLLQCALLIRAGLPSQTYTLGFGPFDSHAAQKTMQADRFTELDEGLTKFFAALAGHTRERDVFVLVTSEFGRQATLNKDLGTDHGQAGMAVFIGAGVKRGVYGQAPTLDPGGPTAPNRVHDALKPTLDFRSVHATALARLAKDDANVADDALNAHYENLGVFAPYVAPPTTTSTSTTTTSTTTTSTTTTTAPNKAPVASMSLNKSSGLAPLTVSGNGGASKDPDGTIVSYAWNWGDGSAPMSGKTVSHKFTKRGTFTVRLTVTDNKGATGTTTKSVRVL